jgi:cell division septum initiation protein DivIVA
MYMVSQSIAPPPDRGVQGIRASADTKGTVTILAETVFKKVFKGYDTAQVDEFIIAMSDKYGENEKELNDRIRTSEAEIARLREEINQMHAEREERESEYRADIAKIQREYDALCAEVGEKMVIADKRAAEIIKNAEKEASLILTDARKGSESEARAIRSRAEDEASRLVEETRKKCESVVAAAEEYRAYQTEMSKSMMETENRFTVALNRLRDEIGEQE